MGLFGKLFGGGGGAKEPWTGPWKDYARGTMPFFAPESLIAGAAAAVQPGSLEKSAEQGLLSFNPASALAGGFGFLGGRPTSYMDTGFGGAQSALSMLQGDMYGAGGTLRSMLSPSFLDIMNDPTIQARNQAVQSMAAKTFQNLLPQIDSQVQLATGGSGLGSAFMNERKRTAMDMATSVADKLAQLNAQDLARREALQQQAVGMGLNVPLERARAMGNIGLNLTRLGGDLGTSLGEALLKGQLGAYGQMGALGNVLAGRQFQAYSLPYQMMIDYLNTSRFQTTKPSKGVIPSIAGMAKDVTALTGLI